MVLQAASLEEQLRNNTRASPLFASTGAEHLGKRAVAVECVVAANRDPQTGQRLIVPPAREMGGVIRTNSLS